MHAVPNAPSVKKYGKAQSEAPSRPLPSLTCSPRRDRSLPARGPSPGVLTDPEMSVAVPSRFALLYSLSRTCFSPVTPRPGERSCQCTDGPPCISQPRGVCWSRRARAPAPMVGGRCCEDQGVQALLPRTVSDELPGVGSLGPWAAQPRSVTLLRALHGGPASARVNQPRGKGLSGRFPCSRGQVVRLEWRGWNSTAPADGFPSGRSRLPLAKLHPGPRVPRPSLRRKSSPGRTGHLVGACGGHVYIPANPRAPRFWGTPLPAPQALCRACPLRLPLTTWPSPS